MMTVMKLFENVIQLVGIVLAMLYKWVTMYGVHKCSTRSKQTIRQWNHSGNACGGAIPQGIF